MGWVSIAFEIAKGLLGIIFESVGASAKKLEELSERFDNLMKVGAEELAAWRAAAKAGEADLDAKRDAAVARIRAARVAQAAGSSP